jgi:hypothetical protein
MQPEIVLTCGLVVCVAVLVGYMAYSFLDRTEDDILNIDPPEETLEELVERLIKESEEDG